MGYKEHNWRELNKKGAIIDVRVSDETGNKMGSFRATNQRDYTKILSMIWEKYGYSSKPNIEENIEKEKDEVKDWLKKDMEW